MGLEVVRADNPKLSDVTACEALIVECGRSEKRDDAARRVANATEMAIRSTGRGLKLSGAMLAYLDLRGFDLSRAVLNRAALHGARLNGANLEGASLVCTGMEKADFEGANLRRIYAHATSAQVCNFDGADLRDVIDATGGLFHGCTFRGAILDNAMLSGTLFYQCDMSGASLRGTCLDASAFAESDLSSSAFERAAVDAATITKSILHEASFEGATGSGLTLRQITCADSLKLETACLPQLTLQSVHAKGIKAAAIEASDAHFVNCALSDAQFGRANLSDSSWLRCTLDGADFSGARLCGAAFRRVAARNAVFSNASAENASVVDSQLSGVDMRGVRARAATFRDCWMPCARLDGAYLYRAFLTGDPPNAMNLSRSNLSGANLVQAYVAADLTGARLDAALGAYVRLNQSKLKNADVRGVGLYGASLVKAVFHGAQLAGVEGPFLSLRCKGLEEALSSGGIDSLAELCSELDAIISSYGRGST